MLPKESTSLGFDIPSIYKCWINIKQDFATIHKLGKNKDMVGMLNDLGLELKGRHHSGLDDCKNIAAIAIKMIENGWTPLSLGYNKLTDKKDESSYVMEHVN
jgi:ERI1 exoribonuclease 3